MGTGGSSVLYQHLGPRFCRPPGLSSEWAIVDISASEKQDWKPTYITIAHPDCFNFYCLLVLTHSLGKKSIPSPGSIKAKQKHQQGSLNGDQWVSSPEHQVGAHRAEGKATKLLQVGQFGLSSASLKLIRPKTNLRIQKAHVPPPYPIKAKAPGSS